MIWWAYAGLTGTIVLSLVLVAWIVGVPANGLMQLAIATTTLMLVTGMLVSLAVVAVRRRRHHHSPRI
jgi:hypothetical protein